MYRQSDGYQYTEDLVRTAPQIEQARLPHLWHPSLFNITITRHLSSLFTDTINCNGSPIQKYSGSVAIGPGLNLHPAISFQEASIDDRVESRGSHKGKQKHAEGSPCRFSRSSYEKDKHCRRELRCKVKLANLNVSIVLGSTR